MTTQFLAFEAVILPVLYEFKVVKDLKTIFPAVRLVALTTSPSQELKSQRFLENRTAQAGGPVNLFSHAAKPRWRAGSV